MTCHMFGDKSILEPMLTHYDLECYEQNLSNKLNEFAFKEIHRKNVICKMLTIFIAGLNVLKFYSKN